LINHRKKLRLVHVERRFCTRFLFCDRTERQYPVFCDLYFCERLYSEPGLQLGPATKI